MSVTYSGLGKNKFLSDVMSHFGQTWFLSVISKSGKALSNRRRSSVADGISVNLASCA